MQVQYILQALVLTVLTSALSFGVPNISYGQKHPYDRIVVFGTSLSDPGNAFILLSNPTDFGFGGCDLGTPQNVPPYDTLDELLIPDGSYARGGHHVTNGATWVEQLARNISLAGSTRPALRNPEGKASNYAVGGARASEYDCRFNLPDQIKAYQNDFPTTSDKALVVIEMGSNDVRDALVWLQDDPAKSVAILNTALQNIGSAIGELYTAGARNFLVVNVPAIDKTPAVKKIPGAADAAVYLIDTLFNPGLAQLLNNLRGSFPGINIMELDIYGLLNEIVADPESFGIVNTNDTCVTPDIPPYTCAQPDTYLFWDGIHPTKAVHDIVAQRAFMSLNQ